MTERAVGETDPLISITMSRIRVDVTIGFAVEVKHHKCDSEQRLENPLQKIQREMEYIKAVCLLGCGKLLDERLWILRRCQLIKIMPKR